MRLLLLAVLIVLFMPNAQAAAGTGLLKDAKNVGQQFWQDRNVTTNPNVTISIVDEPCGQQAEGCVADGLGGKDLQLRRSLVQNATRERYNPNAGGMSQREYLCAVVVHELGHTAGLEHTDSGIMGADSYVIPWACVQWRKSLDRQDRRLAESSSKKSVRHPVRVRVQGRWRGINSKRQSLRLVIPRGLVN